MSTRYLPRDAETLDLTAENYPQLVEYATDLAHTNHTRNQVQAYYGYLREMLRDELIAATGRAA